MTRDDFTDCVRLSEVERRQLYDALELTERCPGKNSSRKFERTPFYGHEVLFTLYEAGNAGSHRYIVLTRNISASGIAILHGGFAYRDTLCELVIRTTQGEMIKIAGSVAHCRLVKGRVHELGVEFRKVIDTECFIGGDAGAMPEALGEIAGGVLALDDQKAELDLLSHHLRETSVELRTARTAEACLVALADAPPDLLLCDLELAPEDVTGVEAMRRIRDGGYEGPIIAVTGHASADKVRAAVSLGAVGVLLKPYDVAKLHQSLAQHLAPVRRAAA